MASIHCWHHGDWLAALGIGTTSVATIGAVWAAWRFTRGDTIRTQKIQAIITTWTSVNQARFSSTQYLLAMELFQTGKSKLTHEDLIPLQQEFMECRTTLSTQNLIIISTFGAKGFILSSKLQSLMLAMATREGGHKESANTIRAICNEIGQIVHIMNQRLSGITNELDKKQIKSALDAADEFSSI
jgi:hypothetical protein